jgi:hypothetical protein
VFNSVVFTLFLIGLVLMLGFALVQLWRKGAIDKAKAKAIFDADAAAVHDAAGKAVDKAVDASKTLIQKVKE